MRNRIPLRAICMIQLIGTLLCCNGSADTLTFTPVADSYIRDQEPDVNSGSDFSNVAGALGTATPNQFPMEVRRILMQFDVSAIPQNAVINSVTLQVTVVKTPPPSTAPSSYFDLKRLLRPWTEGGVTWNSTSPGTFWEQPGAMGSADSAATPGARVFITAPSTLPMSFTFASSQGLVADVQAWVSNPTSNNGWLMMSESESLARTARRFGAREDPPDAPVLTVVYSIPALSIVTQPQSQTAPVNSSVTFQVGVAGIPPFAYEWFFNGNALPGATNSSLTLNGIQTNQAGSYFVTVSNSSGSTNSGVATLTVEVAQPGAPIVAITSPPASSKFPAHANVTLAADATESNGVIAQVEFFLGTNSAGVATSPPYTVTTNNVPTGNYSVRAVATDNSGKTGSSAVVTFSVFDPPDITLSAPGAPFRFPLGANVTVSATVTGKGAKIQSVSFFSRLTNSEGNIETINIGVATNAPYTIPWTPASAGDYSLSAVVLDELGQTNQSAAVFVRFFIPELIPPTITITNGPANLSTVSNPAVTLQGAASDNVGLDRVEFQVATGPFLSIPGTNVTANGTANWSAQISLSPGRNLVRVRSVDLAGNKSPDAFRVITYSQSEPLTVQIVGDGTISPDLNGRLLELGKIYTVRARPGSGQIFVGWSGATTTNNPLLSFEMKSNLMLTATFMANPFPAVAGAYIGVFLNADTNLFRPENAGFLRLQLARDGSFTSQVTMQEGRYGFGGKFDSHGSAQISVVRRVLSPITFRLLVDLTNGTGLITGTASASSRGLLLTANLLAARNSFNSTSNPAPQAGRHSFVFQTVSAEPQTIATGEANVGKIGTVEIHGSFQGQKFSLSSVVAAAGNVPFFISLKQGSDVVAGWLTFGGGTTGATGELYWVHAGVSGVVLLEQTSQ